MDLENKENDQVNEGNQNNLVKAIGNRKSKHVECFDINTNEILRIFPSQTITASSLNIPVTIIHNCCKGTREIYSKNSSLGFRFRFTDNTTYDDGKCFFSL